MISMLLNLVFFVTKKWVVGARSSFGEEKDGSAPSACAPSGRRYYPRPNGTVSLRPKMNAAAAVSTTICFDNIFDPSHCRRLRRTAPYTGVNLRRKTRKTSPRKANHGANCRCHELANSGTFPGDSFPLHVDLSFP